MLWILTFIPVFAVVIVTLLVVDRTLSARQRSALNEVLRETPAAAPRQLFPLLIKPGKVVISGLVTHFNFKEKLDRRIRQAGVTWSAAGILWMMAGGAILGALLGARFHILLSPVPSSAALALALGFSPLVPLFSKRRSRLRAFEQQLPDALDFLARAMRAGHAFSTSLRIMAEEAPDPLGQEFRKVSAEHNLGAPLSQALEALVERVPLLDLQFFTAAVTLQKQTGGNLSEVMLKLGQIIRERFALRGKVRATSAHGRLTGLVLTSMPLGLALFLMITSPDYLLLLQKDPLGKYLIIAAVAGQILGYLCIQKLVDFEV